MTLVKFSNGGNKCSSLSPLFNDLFESLLSTDPFVSYRMVSRVPVVNIAETEDEYHIELAVPGMKKDDFKINLEANRLSISSESRTENSETDETKKYNRKEYSYSSFVRTFTLPESADYSNISAEYTDGILRITVAKKEEVRIQTREISIR
jgi:HSP20 family protein